MDKKHNIERRSSAETQSDGNPTPLRDENWLRQQYHEENKTTTEIADELGVSQSTVGTWMEKHGIERRERSEINTDGESAKLDSQGWIYREYWEKGRDVSDIAEELRLSQRAVIQYMDRHGIERRAMSEAKADGNVTPLKDAGWLRTEYVEKEKSAQVIADELGVHPKTVSEWCKRHGIGIRTLSEANAEGDVEPLRDKE